MLPIPQHRRKFAIYYCEDGELVECFEDTPEKLFNKLAVLNTQALQLQVARSVTYAERVQLPFTVFHAQLLMADGSETEAVAFGFDETDKFWVKLIPVFNQLSS